MKIIVSETSKELGLRAAAYTAERLRNAIDQKGVARILLSTGASQFDTLEALVKENVDWSKVEMFHLDEYVNLPETHPASFRKYLKERFVAKVQGLKAAYFVNGEGSVEENIKKLGDKLLERPVDVGLIGIGENGHIAFNDPPADFETEEPYIIVNLNDTCKKQQVGEGWFTSENDVPKQAVSMSVHQIMACKEIICCVPDERKANAIRLMLENDVTPMVPATKLKEHPCVRVYLDSSSAKLANKIQLEELN